MGTTTTFKSARETGSTSQPSRSSEGAAPAPVDHRSDGRRTKRGSKMEASEQDAPGPVDCRVVRDRRIALSAQTGMRR
jgi:hypothetical protein